MHRFVLATLTAVALTSITTASSHTWTNSDGQKIEAELVQLENGVAKLKLPNGKTYDYELKKLSAEDQKFAKSEAELLKERAADKEKAKLAQRETFNHTKFEDALNQAQKFDVPILLIFSGSDWCGPCIQLHDTVIESKRFTDYARSHLVVMTADIPKRGNRTNERLKDKYDGRFPSMHILNSKGKQVGEMWSGYGGQPSSEVIGWINECSAKISPSR